MQSVTGQEAEVFRHALTTLNESGVPYVIGGAFAVYHYGGAFRNTNDLDVFVERKGVPEAIQALSRGGFADYGEMAAGDRDWIYHATMHDVLIDVIWQAPNGIATVGERQFERGREGTFLEIPTRFMPPDDLVLTKIFTMNQHRCDWPDILRVVRVCPDDFDWHHMIEVLGEHWPVLLSFIILFDWVYPGDADCIPSEIRETLLRQKLNMPKTGIPATREAMLDPWIYTRPVSA